MKLALRLAVVLALTAALLAVWARSFDAEALWRAVREASLPLLLVAALVNLLHVPTRAWRWRALLDVGGPLPPYRELVLTTAVGYLVSFVIPGRIGEVVRPALLSARSEVPLGAALASVVFERLLDVAVLVVLLGAFVLLTPELASAELRRTAAVLAAAAAIGLVVGIVVHRRWRSGLDLLVSRLARKLPGRVGLGAERLGLTALRGFDSLLRPGAWWRLPLMSLVVWSTSIGAFELVLAAGGAEVVRTTSLLMTAVGALGMAVPTPGGVGGFEAVFTHVLAETFGVPGGRAAALALLSHLVAVVPALLLGLYYFLREGLSVDSLRAAARSGREAEPEAGEREDDER